MKILSTREYVVAIISIEIGIEQLNSKMDRKLPKEKTKFTHKLRDPMTALYFYFFVLLDDGYV